MTSPVVTTARIVEDALVGDTLPQVQSARPLHF